MVTQVTTLTLSELITKFLRSRQDLAPGTIDYYRTLLSNFGWYARSQGWPEAAAITRDHIRDFLSYVATESYRWPGMQRCSLKKAAPSTIYHYGKVVKTLFNWAEAEEYLDHNPSIRLRLGRPHYKEVEPYSDEEVRAMLEVCDYDSVRRYRYLGIRNKAIISLLADTGLRVSELGAIRLSDLDPNSGSYGLWARGPS